MLDDGLDDFHFHLVLFVATLCHVGCFGKARVGCFDIRQNKFQVDNFHVVNGVDIGGYVCDVTVNKTTYNVHDGINLADVGQKLVAQTFATACALYKAGNIHKLEICWSDLFGIVQTCKFVEALVWNGNYAHVWLDCAKWVVGDFRACLCDCVKQRAFAYVWQTYNT